jgi:hypothetical protein
LTVKLEGPASSAPPWPVDPDEEPHPVVASSAMATVENTMLIFMSRPSFWGRRAGAPDVAEGTLVSGVPL